jgi:hypothetical protein
MKVYHSLLFKANIVPFYKYIQHIDHLASMYPDRSTFKTKQKVDIRGIE